MSNAFSFDDNDDAPSSPRSAPARSSSRWSPVRFFSPGTFGAAVILFFLPWTDLSCNTPKGKMQLVTQSGFQSATGEASEGDGFAKLRETEGMQTGKKAAPKFDLNELKNNPVQKNAGRTEKADEKAPLLWGYLVLLIGGAAAPVFLASTRMRGAVILGIAGLAALILGIQLLMGLPLPNAAADFNSELKKADDIGRNTVGAQLNIGKMEMKATYLPSFFASLVFLLMSVALGLVQLSVGGPKGVATGQRRARDDLD